MPRPQKKSPRHFSAETFGEFIKTVREAKGMHVADVAREADVNRQGLLKLEQGLHLPTIRTIEAICNPMGLDPLFAIGKGFGEASGRAAGRHYVIEGRLAELSEADLALTLDFIDLLRARAKGAGKAKRKTGRA